MKLCFFDFKLLGRVAIITSDDDILLTLYLSKNGELDLNIIAKGLGSRKNELNKLSLVKPSNFAKEVQKWLSAYEQGSKEGFKLAFELNLSPFSNKVLNELYKCPYGKLLSYKELAKLSGRERAFRAVGSINNKNPLPIIIACHRVIKANGQLGGFGYDIALKKLLLKIEGISF